MQQAQAPTRREPSRFDNHEGLSSVEPGRATTALSFASAHILVAKTGETVQPEPTGYGRNGSKAAISRLKKKLSYWHAFVLRPGSPFVEARSPHPLPYLSRPRRPHRSAEWTAGKAVTFIVTLAATGSVTLAAREAGMSRKSAYALKARDAQFAAAWNAALRARKGPALSLSRSDKAEEVREPPVSRSQGDKQPAAAPSNWSSIRRRHDEAVRDLFFARLAATQVATVASPQ